MTTWMRGGLLVAALGLPLAAGCNTKDTMTDDTRASAAGGARAGNDGMPGDAGRVGDPAKTDPTPLTAAPPDRAVSGPSETAKPEDIHGSNPPVGPSTGTGAGPSSGDAADKTKDAAGGTGGTDQPRPDAEGSTGPGR